MGEVLKRRKTKRIKKKRKRKKTKTRQKIPDRTRARKSCHQSPKNLLPRSKSILQLQPPSILICQAVPRQKNQHLFRLKKICLAFQVKKRRRKRKNEIGLKKRRLL